MSRPVARTVYEFAKRNIPSINTIPTPLYTPPNHAHEHHNEAVPPHPTIPLDEFKSKYFPIQPVFGPLETETATSYSNEIDLDELVAEYGTSVRAVHNAMTAGMFVGAFAFMRYGIDVESIYHNMFQQEEYIWKVGESPLATPGTVLAAALGVGAMSQTRLKITKAMAPTIMKIFGKTQKKHKDHWLKGSNNPEF